MPPSSMYNRKRYGVSSNHKRLIKILLKKGFSSPGNTAPMIVVIDFDGFDTIPG
ncbi:hypothetical protein PISMIDRAFT_689805, partial [Pisolithus microcarpus 441]